MKKYGVVLVLGMLTTSLAQAFTVYSIPAGYHYDCNWSVYTENYVCGNWVKDNVRPAPNVPMAPFSSQPPRTISSKEALTKYNVQPGPKNN